MRWPRRWRRCGGRRVAGRRRCRRRWRSPRSCWCRGSRASAGCIRAGTSACTPSDEPVDLAAGEADAAIRYGLGRYPGLVALPLLTDGFAPVCSPHAGLRAPEDLAGATLIHFEWGAQATRVNVPSWRAWAERAGIGWLDAEAGITFNDEASAIDATIAGQGVALLSTALVARELASGALIRPFGPELEGLRYDLVYPEGAETRPAVAVLRSWVTSELAR